MVLQFPVSEDFPELSGSRAVMLDNSGHIHSLRQLGWELDASVVDVARMFLGMGALEDEGALGVRIGDALSPSVELEAPFSSIVVDLFSGAALLPQLTQVATWHKLRSWLTPGGRVVANLGEMSKVGGAGEAALAAMAEAFDGELLVHVLDTGNAANLMALTGPMLTPEQQGAVPQLLREYVVGCWRLYKPGDWPQVTPEAAAALAKAAAASDAAMEAMEAKKAARRAEIAAQKAAGTFPKLPEGGGFSFVDQDDD